MTGQEMTVTFAGAAGSSRACGAYVNSLTHEGESACFLAAQRGHLAVVQLLLEARADINQLTNDLSCPLYAGIPPAPNQADLTLPAFSPGANCFQQL